MGRGTAKDVTAAARREQATKLQEEAEAKREAATKARIEMGQVQDQLRAVQQIDKENRAVWNSYNDVVEASGDTIKADIAEAQRLEALAAQNPSSAQEFRTHAAHYRQHAADTQAEAQSATQQLRATERTILTNQLKEEELTAREHELAQFQHDTDQAADALDRQAQAIEESQDTGQTQTHATTEDGTLADNLASLPPDPSSMDDAPAATTDAAHHASIDDSAPAAASPTSNTDLRLDVSAEQDQPPAGGDLTSASEPSDEMAALPDNDPGPVSQPEEPPAPEPDPADDADMSSSADAE